MIVLGGSRTTFFTIIFGIFPKVELPTSRYFENSQSLGILISQRLGNIPIFGKFQFPTIHRNFHIFSIAYLSEVVSSHFFVRTSLSFQLHHQSFSSITTMVGEEDRQRVAQESKTRLSGISRHNKLLQNGVGAWCPDNHLACTPEPVMCLTARKTIVAVVPRVRTNDGQFRCVCHVCTQLHM